MRRGGEPDSPPKRPPPPARTPPSPAPSPYSLKAGKQAAGKSPADPIGHGTGPVAQPPGCKQRLMLGGRASPRAPTSSVSRRRLNSGNPRPPACVDWAKRPDCSHGERRLCGPTPQIIRLMLMLRSRCCMLSPCLSVRPSALARGTRGPGSQTRPPPRWRARTNACPPAPRQTRPRTET